MASDLERKAAHQWAQISIRQQVKGLAKYGQPLDSATGYDWITMAQEELYDAFIYLEKLRMERDGK